VITLPRRVARRIRLAAALAAVAVGVAACGGGGGGSDSGYKEPAGAPLETVTVKGGHLFF
jgi:hypothetical protein